MCCSAATCPLIAAIDGVSPDRATGAAWRLSPELPAGGPRMSWPRMPDECLHLPDVSLTLSVSTKGKCPTPPFQVVLGLSQRRLAV